ncbi:MAG: SDR family NAD(P)-dependent oxidoreductase, partial [Acidimicrobiales bacterium]
MSLDGEVAIVAGGASGIGLATARRLAAEGAAVLVVDLDPEGGEAAAEELGGRFVHADVADPRQWDVAVREAERAFGGVDIAHLNPGVTSGVGAIEEMTDEQYERTLRTNIDGIAYGIRAVVPA